jgi:hypothetical protein
MFSLFFFNGNDAELAFDIQDKKARYNEEYVKEGEFDTLEVAENRLDNIGSRWFFYPNACIMEEERLYSIHMADGFSYFLKRSEEFVEV